MKHYNEYKAEQLFEPMLETKDAEFEIVAREDLDKDEIEDLRKRTPLVNELGELKKMAEDEAPKNNP